MIHQPTPSPFDHAAERARSRFQGALAREAMQARIEARPLLPLRPDQVVACQGETFSVERLETGGFDTLSATAKYLVTLIRHSDGRRAEYTVIRKERRSRATGRATVRYNAPTGNYSTWDDLLDALLTVTAERLSVCTHHDAQPYGGPRNEGDQESAWGRI